MRHELVMAGKKRHADTSPLDEFPLLTAICLAGAVLSVYFSSSCQVFAALQSLIVQYHLC